MIAEATVSVQARLTVITAAMPSRLERVLPELCAQNVHWNLAIGGAGASQELADRCDALHLPNDPISAADFAFG